MASTPCSVGTGSSSCLVHLPQCDIIMHVGFCVPFHDSRSPWGRLLSCVVYAICSIMSEFQMYVRIIAGG